jgi:hypothetical protein
MPIDRVFAHSRIIVLRSRSRSACMSLNRSTTADSSGSRRRGSPPGEWRQNPIQCQWQSAWKFSWAYFGAFVGQLGNAPLALVIHGGHSRRPVCPRNRSFFHSCVTRHADVMSRSAIALPQSLPQGINALACFRLGQLGVVGVRIMRLLGKRLETRGLSSRHGLIARDPLLGIFEPVRGRLVTSASSASR